MKKWLLAGVLCLIIILSVVFFMSRENSSPTVNLPGPVGLKLDEPIAEKSIEEESINKFDEVKLQELVDVWVGQVGGSSSVVITNTEGKVLASHQPDKVYFAASIYKLYVAYEGYKNIDDGTWDASELYLNGNSRQECLDLMIRNSDSPCAEKMWVELGKLTLNEQLRSYGIMNTDMVSIQTTAMDATKIMQRIISNTELTDESKNAYLDSMLTQDELYRRGLPSGFSESVKAYNKVGWNEQQEWHDVALVEFEDGRKLIISVFTENVGSRQISNFAKDIENII